MTERDHPVQKSLLQQILDEMFSDLEARGEFDLATVDRLRTVGINGQLKKVEAVASAIKPSSEAVS